MGHWLATLRQKTEGACSADAEWTDPGKSHHLYVSNRELYEDYLLPRQNNSG